MSTIPSHSVYALSTRVSDCRRCCQVDHPNRRRSGVAPGTLAKWPPAGLFRESVDHWQPTIRPPVRIFRSNGRRVADALETPVFIVALGYLPTYRVVVSQLNFSLETISSRQDRDQVPMPRTSSAAAKTSDNGQEPAWSIPSLREPRYSQSLERGLAILGCFTPKRPVLGIADIADELGMSRSTTHRYVITLVALGYLEQGASRKYRLGLRVTDLGMSALNSTGLREHAHPYLEELRQRTSYTTSLGVLDGRRHPVRRPRAQLPPRPEQASTSTCTPARALPAYCTSMGKLLLANLPEPEQRELIAADEADQARPQHDHEQESAARGARRGPRGGLRRQRRGAGAPSCTRSPRPCATRPARSSPPSTSPRTAR